MGSVKKKIDKVMNKVADKIVPKEIAPILPIAAMMIPGLQGMSPLMRYGLPQLATALSSAKRTGRINPMAQALTGITSYAMGPGGQAASGKQDAFYNANVGPTVEANVPFANTTEGLLDPASKLDFTKGMSPVEFAQENAKAFKAFEYTPSSMFEQAGNLFRPAVQKAGSALNDPFGSFGNFATAASLAGAPTLMNEMTLSADKAKAEEAAAAAAAEQALTDRQNAINNLTGYYGQLGTDPLLQDIFGNYQFVNEGGRIGYGMGSNEQGVQSQGIPPGFDDPSDYAEYLIDPEAYIMKKYLEMSDNEPIIMGPEDYNMGRAHGGRIGHALGDMAGGLGSMYPMNPAPGSVAPNMPQGMQVDGRNGTFIPMGAKEKHDDVPAMLAKNEFVMTSDAVKGMGNGDVNKGAQKMYDLMNQLEANV